MCELREGYGIDNNFVRVLKMVWKYEEGGEGELNVFLLVFVLCG